MAALYDDFGEDPLLGEAQDDDEDFFAPNEVPPTRPAFLEEAEDDEEFGGAAAADADAADGAEEPEQQPEQQEEPAADARAEVEDRRARLKQLARQHAGGGDGEGPKKKKHKKDRGGEQQQQRGSGRPKRVRPQRGSGEDDEAAGGAGKRPRDAFEPQLPEDEYVETAEDKDFIDDDGVPEEERYEREDEEVFGRAEEAEEALPGEEEGPEPTNIVDQVLAGRKRRKKQSENDLSMDTYALVARMTACAEKDAETMAAPTKQPAMEKFKALPEVNTMLRQRKYHESFIQMGGLGAMQKWLNPYSNGELPNAKVRSVLVDLLGLMSLDTSSDYIREKLEESGLGKVIMFYFKNPAEKNMALRSKCRDLVQNWSAPIFADADEEQRKRRQREREHRIRMVAERSERERRERREAEEAEHRRNAKQGQEGFRARAAVPQPSRLDFVINPGSRRDPLEAAMQRPAAGNARGSSSSQSAKNKSPIGGKLGKVLQKQKRGVRDRFGGVSVEGRGIQM